MLELWLVEISWDDSVHPSVLRQTEDQQSHPKVYTNKKAAEKARDRFADMFPAVAYTVVSADVQEADWVW